MVPKKVRISSNVIANISDNLKKGLLDKIKMPELNNPVTKINYAGIDEKNKRVPCYKLE